MEDVLLLAGRILFAGVLLYNGVNHFLSTDSLTGYAEFKGIPQPRIAVFASGIVLLASGLSILLGVYPFVGSLVAVAFLIVAGVLIHNFWAVEDPEARTNDLNQFLKNIGMAGGALVLASTATEVWAYSLELGLYV